MRDIVNTSYSASTLQTRAKKANATDGNGTLTKTDYKSYRGFLESYTNETKNSSSKDDQESVSSTDSGISSCNKLFESKSNNTSSSSLNSEINGAKGQPKAVGGGTGATRTGSFRDYMDNYTNKRFSSVKPTIAAKQNLIKSEIVIQVNGPAGKRPGVARHEVQVTTLDGDQEEPDFQPPQDDFELPPPPPPSQVPNFVPPPPPQVPNFVPPPPPPPTLPPPDFGGCRGGNCGAKKWAPIETESCGGGGGNRSNPNNDKVPANGAAANLAKILTEHLQPRRKLLDEIDCKQNGAAPPPKTNGVENGGLIKLKAQASVQLKPLKLPNSPPPQLPKSLPPQLHKSPPPQLPKSLPPQLPRSPPPQLPKFPPPKSSTSPPPPLPHSSPPKFSYIQPPKVPNSPPPPLPQSSPPKFVQTQTLKVNQPSQSPPPPQLSRSPPPKFVTVSVPKPSHSPPPKLPGSLPPHKGHQTGPKLPQAQSGSDSVDYNTTTVVSVTDGSTKVNKNDPNVRKLVYNTYRGLLGAYNNKANDMIATLPRNMVKEDQGVARQLESIAQAAPPPPPGATGHIPSSRLKSEVSDRRVEPPLCVQNAMLTKDKKPFTYTPGGLDLSEIRSPRMARRLEMNAMNEGVAPLPQAHPNYPTGPLPPSALAAMQPQLPVQVFPSGGIPQPHHGGGGGGGGGAPPPPPPPSGAPPPPPPPRGPSMRPTSPLPRDAFERPDMTKIIPENPMALLRKTSGPVIKQDPIFNKNNYAGDQNAAPQRQPQSPPFANQTSFANQRDSPTRAAPPYYKRQPPTPQAEPQSPPSLPQRNMQTVTSPIQRETVQAPDSPKPTLTKAPPAAWLTQRRQLSQDLPEWATNDQRAQTPPVAAEDRDQQKKQSRPWLQEQEPQATPWQQRQPQPESQSWQQKQQQPEPQSWQQRQQPEPQQPWQQRQQPPQQQQQPELQPWQHRQQSLPETQPWLQKPPQQPELQPWQQRQHSSEVPPWQQQQQQQRQPQSRPAQSPPVQIPQGGGVRKQVQLRDNPQESGPMERTEVVIVNEPPQIFHHPGQRGPSRPQQNNYQQQRNDTGVRVIPVQIESSTSNGHVRTPATPGANSDSRSYNRQQSWNSTPTQSNTFKVLQKITQTDGDDDDDQPVIEHSPKTPQHFPQRQVSTEQVRRMKQNDNDQDVTNKFRQELQLNDYYENPRYRGGHIPSKLFWMLDDSGLNQDSSLHNEVDPRYRGPNIPSKAFKLLQSMTGGPDELPISSSTVPQNQQSNNRGPKVRTIPIQIEGDGPTKTYVPPSEQTVPEPKKYMGSSIPSRSFKILQAMTAPDDCANPDRACENNENYANDTSSSASYGQWGFDPNYPPPSYYYDPYWGYYHQNYPPEIPPETDTNKNGRMTPVPQSWGYYPSNYAQPATRASSENSETETDANKKRNARSTPVPAAWAGDGSDSKRPARCTPTPVPFWPYYYPYSYDNAAPQQTGETAPENDPNGNATVNEDQQQNYAQYPPYWDPYYYGYYYGAPPPPMYPPMYSPYPFYPPPQSDNEEVSGYSSTDEMAYYGSRFSNMPPFAGNSNNGNGNARSRNVATPSLQQQLMQEIKEAARKLEESRKKKEEKPAKVEKIRIQSERFEDDSSIASDSDTEMVGYEICQKPGGGGLKAIRSVSNIKVYDDEEESSHCSDEEEEEDEDVSENTTEEIDDPSSVYAVDETIPHQLSVIFEESERTDSAARNARESSVATTISEGTNTVENSEDEEEAAESDGTVLVKLPLTFKFTMAESQKVATLTVGTSQIQPQVALKHETAYRSSSEEYKPSRNEEGVESEDLSLGNDLETRTDEYDEEDEVDWWDEISKSEDLPKKSLREVSDSETHSETTTNSINTVIEQPVNVAKTLDLNNVDNNQLGLSNVGNLSTDTIAGKEKDDLDFWSEVSKEEAQPEISIYEDGFSEDQRMIPEANSVQGHSVISSPTISPPKNKEAEQFNYKEEVDFWAEIMSESDKPSNDEVFYEEFETSCVQNHGMEEGAGSACSRNSSLSSSEVPRAVQNSIIESQEVPLNSEQIKTEVEDGSRTLEEEPVDAKPLTVQERIKELHAAAGVKQALPQQDHQEAEVKVSIKERISALEDNSNATLSVEKSTQHKRRSMSRKNSLKSYEEFSEEEEGDSGVTSDISRHISETDTEPDLQEFKKMKYQRASTHSRLFKLLQDECDEENETEEVVLEEEVAVQQQNRRDRLNLPLQKNGSDPDSFSSSGFTSPGSPTINDRFVNELVQTLLRKKQGKVFKNVTMEKLHAAALRILQEDMDGLETLSSSEDGGSFLSPKKPGTGSSTPARTPQEFYSNCNEYSQYYDSWAGAERFYENGGGGGGGGGEVLPSKAFKLIQEQAALNKTGAIGGLLARCPRVLSNKNVRKELMKLIEGHESPAPSPDPPERPPDTKEATSAS